MIGNLSFHSILLVAITIRNMAYIPMLLLNVGKQYNFIKFWILVMGGVNRFARIIPVTKLLHDCDNQ